MPRSRTRPRRRRRSRAAPAPGCRTRRAARASRRRCRARDGRRTRCASSLARAAERDHRIARRGPDPLADPIDHDDRADRRPGAADEREREPRDRRQPVARGRDLLVPAPAVARDAARDPDERRDALVEPVDDPELDRAEPEPEDEVQRQDRHDHLGRDVGEHAREPEQDHRSADRRRAAGAVRPRRRPRRFGRSDLVHARTRRGTVHECARAPPPAVHRPFVQAAARAPGALRPPRRAPRAARCTPGPSPRPPADR